MQPTQETEPAVACSDVSFTYPEAEKPVFEHLDLELPHGVVSFVGRNGTGKSTALLLASGRVLPQTGQVRLFDVDTASIPDETERNRYASFVYQNMEFETEEPIGDLFEYVYANGFHERKDPSFLKDLVETFELGQSTHRKLQLLSKGEMQRAILVFSMLYGSRAIMMDEPIFALEDYQKRRALEFITDYARRTLTPVYFSLHELDLSYTFADFWLLFYRDGSAPVLGTPEEIFTTERMEAAYEFPLPMLRQREYLFRERLYQLAGGTDTTEEE